VKHVAAAPRADVLKPRSDDPVSGASIESFFQALLRPRTAAPQRRGPNFWGGTKPGVQFTVAFNKVCLDADYFTGKYASREPRSFFASTTGTPLLSRFLPARTKVRRGCLLRWDACC
jgi:hypothetical protein